MIKPLPQAGEIMKNWVDTLIDETKEELALKILLGQLRHKFGESSIDHSVVNQLTGLPIAKFEQLSTQMLDFRSVDDLLEWLDAEA